MSSKKTTIKREVVSAPQNLEEAAQFIAEIGQNQRKIGQIQNRFNNEIEKLEDVALVCVSPLEKNIRRLSEGLFIFAQGRRMELTEEGKHKTVELPTGIFGWRFTPWKVSLCNAKEILKTIIAMDLVCFIRTKKEIDKQALLKERGIAGRIPGVSFKQQEEFFVKPAEVDLEITYPPDKKLKKTTSER